MYLPTVYKERTHQITWLDVPRNPISLSKIKSFLKTVSFGGIKIHNQRPAGTPTFRIQSFHGMGSGHIVHRTE